MSNEKKKYALLFLGFLPFLRASEALWEGSIKKREKDIFFISMKEKRMAIDKIIFTQNCRLMMKYFRPAFYLIIDYFGSQLQI